jgi:hypothetical protein
MDRPKIKHEDWDDEDFERDYNDMECQTCGGEFPNGCICYTKNKSPVWINN